MKYYIIAGEASGDAHGAKLIKAIRHHDPGSVFRFWGGDKMSNESETIAMHIRDTSFMGFLEVAKNIRQILSLFTYARKDIKAFNPDVVVLIDYPGFNLRIAKWLYGKGFKVIYYIAPQVWAWKENRVRQLRKYFDKVITILPFEEAYFRDRGVDAIYVGHPLLEDYNSTINMKSRDHKDNIVTIFPGSRKQEISKMLGPMIQGAKKYKPEQIVISKVSHIDLDNYTSLYHTDSDLEISISELPASKLLENTRLAIVASGTASLEAALSSIPHVVCYKTSYTSYLLGRLLIKVKYISLVNLILGRRLIPELIQQQCNAESICKSLKWLEENSTAVIEGYREIVSMLQPDNASQKAAEIIVNTTSSYHSKP